MNTKFKWKCLTNLRLNIFCRHLWLCLEFSGSEWLINYKQRTFLNSLLLGNCITILILYTSYLSLWDNSGSPLSFHLITILICCRTDGDSSVPTSWDAIFDCIARGIFLHKWKSEKIWQWWITDERINTYTHKLKQFINYLCEKKTHIHLILVGTKRYYHFVYVDTN